jgi:hypothetical protein
LVASYMPAHDAMTRAGNAYWLMNATHQTGEARGDAVYEPRINGAFTSASRLAAVLGNTSRSFAQGL